jgi:hypothetical protein
MLLVFIVVKKVSIEGKREKQSYVNNRKTQQNTQKIPSEGEEGLFTITFFLHYH